MDVSDLVFAAEPALMRALVHFALLGALAFSVERTLESAAPPATAAPGRELIEISRERRAEVRSAALARSGRLPDETELARLVEEEIDEEILVREALRNGLERDDPVVHARLVQNMRFLSDADAPALWADAALYRQALELGMGASDLVVRRRLALRMRLQLEERAPASEPGEAELRAYHAAHAEEFAEPARLQLEHVLLSRAALPVAIPESISERTLARLLGDELARAAFSAPRGVWVGPVRSPLGWHRIRVESRTPTRLPGFEALRERVLDSVRSQRRSLAVEAALRDLRASYRVRPDEAP